MVVRRKRLFQPADIEFFHRRHHGARVFHAVADVGVRQYHEIVAECFAHGGDAFEIALGRIADAQFQCFITGL